MDQFEQHAVDAVRNLWATYLMKRTPGELHTLFELVSSDIVLIGTGKHEFYISLDSMKNLISDDLRDAPNVEFEVVDEWYAVQRVSQTVCVVYGTFWAREKNQLKKRVIADLDTRFSIVCCKQGDAVVITHVHHSVPSIDQQSGEFYPKTITEKANEAIERYAQLESRLQHDQLTGLYNRDYAETYIEHSLSEQTPSVLFVIDIDNFKIVNDTFGHLRGDEVLKHFAALLIESFHKDDMIARIGGDEFVVLMKQAEPLAAIEQRAGQLIANFSDYLSASPKLCAVSCSIGIAFAPQDGRCYRDLFGAADQALYQVKFSGKSAFALRSSPTEWNTP